MGKAAIPEYRENKRITGDYDRDLAVKCINGTFVGSEKDGIKIFRGIPFVGAQPAGEHMFKAPVPFVPDDGVYEALYFAKSCPQHYKDVTKQKKGQSAERDAFCRIRLPFSGVTRRKGSCFRLFPSDPAYIFSCNTEKRQLFCPCFHQSSCPLGDPGSVNRCAGIRAYNKKKGIPAEKKRQVSGINQHASVLHPPWRDSLE